MASKRNISLLIPSLFAIFLFVSSDVAARELKEISGRDRDRAALSGGGRFFVGGPYGAGGGYFGYGSPFVGPYGGSYGGSYDGGFGFPFPGYSGFGPFGNNPGRTGGFGNNPGRTGGFGNIPGVPVGFPGGSGGFGNFPGGGRLP